MRDKHALARCFIRELCWLYYWQGNIEKAEKYLKDGTKLAKELNDKTLLALAWIRFGKIYQSKKKCDKAFQYFEQALAYYKLGLFHDNNTRESEAIPNYEMALKLGLERNLKSKALVWLASSLYKTGKPKEALKRTRQSMEIANKDLQVFLVGLEKRIIKSILSRK